MRQLIPFDQSKGGSVPLYCLRNVRLGYGIGAKYPNAITAWNNTEQHKDRNIPLGVDVPLYYSWKVDGHINVRLKDGRIWNDGKIFANLDSFLSSWGNVSYLGWGESINGVKVIEGETMQAQDIKNFCGAVFGVPADAEDLSKAGQSWHDVMYYLAGKYQNNFRNIIAEKDKYIGELQVALTNEQNEPPEVVIKEVEKIVEKIVEVEKPVDEQVVVQNWLVRLWNSLFKKG